MSNQKNKADDWRIEYVIVRDFGENDYETVSLSMPGQGFTSIVDANEVLKKLKKLKKASAEVGADPPAKFDIHVLAVNSNYGTMTLEMPGEDGEEDH